MVKALAIRRDEEVLNPEIAAHLGLGRWQRDGLHLAGKHGIVVAVLGDNGTRFDRPFEGAVQFNLHIPNL